jgi:biopolymer transport protein ExbB
MTTLFHIMQKGGAVMWPLYVLLVVTIVLSVERASTLISLALKREEPRVRKSLERPLQLFDLVAIIAPVLGFLGTVTGMIKAFRTIADSQAVQLQHLASGLYEALYTTAFGLIISIIATVAGFTLELAIEALCEKDQI